jgi:hypothetical protein
MGIVAHHLGCTRVITWKISLNLSLDNRCSRRAVGGEGGGSCCWVAVEESSLKAYFVSSDLLVGELDVQRLSGGSGSLGIIVC